jgi:hypothetical protein
MRSLAQRRQRQRQMCGGSTTSGLGKLASMQRAGCVLVCLAATDLWVTRSISHIEAVIGITASRSCSELLCSSPAWLPDGLSSNRL